MIENLLIGCSAYFFERKKALTDSAVENWFAELQRDAQNAMTPLFKEIRKMHGEVRYSTICFAYDRPTAFLNKDAGVVDRIHGYMLIVEHQNHVAVHSIGLKLSLNIKKDWLKPVANNAVNAAIAKAGSKFESMQLRSMSTSNRVLRKKTMEADDLENAMPMAGASRYVGQRYRLRRGTQRYTATPSTGRISLSTDRSGFKTAISWSVDVMAELEVSTGALSPFIENFARPVSLTSIPLTAKPTNFAIDVAELTDRIFSEYSTIKLVKKDLKGQFRELNETECRKILQILDGEFKVAGSRDSLNILNLTDNSKVGTLRWGKDRIGLSTFALQETKGIYVASADDIDHGKNRLSLKIYLDSENLFIILFDTINLAYINGNLFEDSAIRDGGLFFLSHLIPYDCLASASSEKGKFKKNQRSFSSNSVFSQLEKVIAGQDDVLICDDLGDEWADFIGLNTQSKPSTVTFYHAKHGALSLGASSFHISVSQAEKNLGRLTLAQEALSSKFDNWENNPYKSNKKTTKIDRLMRGGTRAKIENDILSLRYSPDLVRRVAIVTSSLSRKAVEKEFQDIKNDSSKRPSAHFVQLYWLLTSFFSACAEVGAIGYVFCQP